MSNLFLLKNSEIIDLFEIKLNDFEGYLYFHGSKNFNRDLVFQGRNYLYIPCEMSNLQYDSEGKQNRPTFSISNVNNFITNIIKDRSDLLGKEFYRKKLLAKDLDAVNFGGQSKNTLGVSSFTEFISSDKFIINKKNLENKERVEFELSNILDIDGLTCPSRKIYNNSCPWQYRGYGCNYGKNLSYSGPYVSILTPAYKSINTLFASYTGNDSIKEYLGLWCSSITAFPDSMVWEPYIRWYTNNDYVKDNMLVPEQLENFASVVGGTAANSDISDNRQLTLAWDSNRNPGMFLNNVLGRLNGRPGIIPMSSNYTNGVDGSRPMKTYLPMFVDYDYSGKDITVLYIIEPTNIFDSVYWDSAYWNMKHGDTSPLGGVFARGLQTQNENTYIGYSGYSGSGYDRYLANSIKNSFQISNSNNRLTGAQKTLVTDINTPTIYACSIPASNGGEIKFFNNGYKIKTMEANYNGLANSTHDINRLGFNFTERSSSQLFFYELMIFQKVLTEEQIKDITSYFGYQYNIDVALSSTVNSDKVPSSSFFIGYEDGNLGIPIADENDKLFLEEKNDDYMVNYDSYGFKNLTYKGDYDSDQTYTKGDFVKIDPDINFDFSKESLTQSSELPSRFFLCVSSNGSKGINPLDNTEIWKEDKCSKKLSGCLARFRTYQGEEMSQNIPFGGFPGTVSYDYELPN